MDITLEEIISLQHQSLNTLGSKFVYLIIRNRTDASGWAAVSNTEFTNITSLSRRGVQKIIKKLAALALIEICTAEDSPTAKKKYRVVAP